MSEADKPCRFAWTERHIQVALSYWFFDYRRQFIIPNLSYGFFHGHRGESDLIVISNARYVTEVEIKCDVYDLRKEIEKAKHRRADLFGPVVKRYYIAAPIEVWENFGDSALPEGAGRIEVYIDHARTPRGRLVKPSACNKAARPLTDKEMLDVLRLAYLRVWNSYADMRIFSEKEQNTGGGKSVPGQ